MKQTGSFFPVSAYTHHLLLFFAHKISLSAAQKNMEGVSSRIGRASSRYGGTAPIFSGPVRKWKKQWVTTQPNNNLRGTGNTNNVTGPKLMLCRWTPLASVHSGDSTMPEKTPKRKFRYAPVS